MDSFWYNLTDEDFENKWEAVSWPLRVTQHVDEINDVLVEETDKFQKIQLNDELILEERIEVLTVQVTNMSALRDFTKVKQFLFAALLFNLSVFLLLRRFTKLLSILEEFGRH